LSDGITIKRYDDKFFIYEDDREITVITDTIEFCLSEKFRGKTTDENNSNFHFHFNINSLTSDMIPKTESLNQEIVLSSSFTPPLFGVTGLPSPFVETNPEFKSNGLLIWINGR